MFRRCGVIFGVIVMISGAASVSATETRRWVVDTVDEMLKGRGQGVQVTAQGQLEWAQGWAAGPDFDEPVILAGARAADGSLIVGTSHPARLYRVTADRRELLTEVPAEQVTAVVMGESGEVVLATSAPGVIYRWSSGELAEIGRLEDGAIWDLALFDGRVIAAAGPPATLYRLVDRGLERWVELPDLHARCLEVHGDRLLVGTSGTGLVAAVDGTGRPAILVDSPFTEISDLAVGGGAVWAAALVGEPAPAPQAAASDNGENGEEEQAEAEISAAADLKLPKVNGKTATSEVLRLTDDGGMLRVHRFTKEVVGAIGWDGAGLLVGTGWEGEVWRFLADGGTRMATVDAVQVVDVLGGGEALLTQGPAAVLWRAAEGDRSGRYRTAPRKFDNPVRLGEYRVDPPSSANRIRFRGGVTDKPDGTWLDWSEWLPATTGTVPLAAARALQWELELAPDSGGRTAVERVEVAAVEVNLPPQIASLTVEDPGVVYLAAPPPSGPVIEAVSPDLSGIFTVIDETERNNSSTKGKKFYRAGYRTVSWKAVDPNEDALRFTLELESRTGFVLPVRDRITASQLGIDTSAVPDGTFRFRLTASDEADNPEDPKISERVSRWFTVDSTPPTVRLERSGATWVAVVSDALSPIVRAEWSRDGDQWQALAPADGLLDGRDERFELPAADGRHLLVVRVLDRHHNRATAGVVEE